MKPAERLEKLRNHAQQIAPEGLEAWMPSVESLEAVGPVDVRVERVGPAAEKLRKGRMLEEIELDALEAIVLPLGRPVIDIVDDSYRTPMHPWAHLGDGEIRKGIESAIPSVGRVEVPNLPQVPYAGTGFVVGEGLIMTNHHVAAIFSRGVGRRGLTFRAGQPADLDFRRERVPSDGVHVDVVEIILVHPWWDMALLRVEGLSENQQPLRLATEVPEGLESRDSAVIGYPAKDSRNDENLQNEIFRGLFNVKRLQPGKIQPRKNIRSYGHVVSAMTHDSSTLGGNSGSAVLDVQSGRVVGLHFAGHYLEANFAVPTHELARDPRVVDAGVNFDGSVPPTDEWDEIWRKADSPVERARRRAPRQPYAAPGSPGTGAAAVSGVGEISVRTDGNSATWTIPLRVTVSLGDRPRIEVGTADDDVDRDDAAVEAPALRIEPDPDYANRPGYQDDFLSDDHTIPVPWLTEDQYTNVAFNQWAQHKRHVLPYHHFSVVMNRERRLAYYTAVNIDGRREKSIDRDDFNDKWFPDPRIEKDEQLFNDAYKGTWNKLDRGHLVRRLDAVWGHDFAAAKRAHDDTFHWTNCCPQYDRFNRNKGTWGGVENYILHNANNRNLKVSVFSGPVFRDDDPILLVPSGTEVEIPLEFWKVVAMVRQNGTLSATAYLISQEQQITQFLDQLEFAFADFGGFQVTVAEIEDLTGLSFHDLREHDPLETGAEAAGTRTRQRLAGFESVVL